MAASKLRIAKPKMTNHPVDVGLRSEAAIREALLARGYAFSVPVGVNQRYDLILDQDSERIRAQCKTGRLRNGVIRFPTLSTRASRTGVFRRDYRGGADLFLIYCPDNRRVYVVPVDEAPSGSMHLRVDSTRNGQSHRVHWADDYELPG